MDPLIGQMIDGRYEVRAVLGQGGMGTVYRAHQRSVDREVAIKLIDPSYSLDPTAVRRFEREAQLASKLSQPNTVSVFDSGTHSDGRLYIAMELIRGRTLHHVLKADGAFSIERAARIAIQICDALDAAHRLGIVHRDLKLDNVMVLDDPPGRDLVKVLDFGLAKQVGELDPRGTGTGIVVGTPRYIAPEVAVGGEMTPAADMYAVGVMFAELVIGQALWKGDSLSKLIFDKMEPGTAVANVPEAVSALVERLIAPAPDHRPSAAETRDQLAMLALTASGSRPARANLGESATVVIKKNGKVRGRRTRRYGTVGIALGVATAASLVAIGFIIPHGSSPPPADVAAVPHDAAIALADAGDEKVTIVITTDPPNGRVRNVHGVMEDAPVTLELATGSTPVSVALGWTVDGSPTQLLAYSTLQVRPDHDQQIVARKPKVTLPGHKRVTVPCRTCATEAMRPTMVLHVESEPSHLAISIDQKQVGTTPIDLDIAQSIEPFRITSNLNGHAIEVVVIPDRDQAITVGRAN